MKHRCKELGELFNKAQSFGCRVEDRVKNVVIFPPDRTVEPYIAHKSEAAFHDHDLAWQCNSEARESLANL